jgi:putative FmdB family regulatory protein
MPVYEYQCSRCGEIFEIFHKINELYQDGCPKCQGSAKRILSPSNFILKGSGFYVNDYPSKSRKQAESSKDKKEPEKPAPAKEEKAEKQA